MTTAATSAKFKRYPNLKIQGCFVFFYLVLLQVTVARNTSTIDDVLMAKVQTNFAIKLSVLKKMDVYKKLNLAISLTKNDTNEGKNHQDYTDNEINVMNSVQQKLRLMKDLLPQRTERKQKRLVKTNIKKLDIDAKRLKDINPMNVDEEKNQKKKSEVEWLMETVIYVVCAVALAGILMLNISYLVHLLTKNGLSKVTSQNRTNLSSSSQMTIMALALLLFHVPVGGDVTGMSASKGTYFQNEAQGRYLQDYVIESFSHMSLFQCQIQCVSRLPKCRSMNYIESENGSSICEINKERQNCALPGEYISREKSFYLETMPETDDEVSCSTCSFHGVIVNTNEQPGFACSCKEGFYGNKCQDDVNECATKPCHANATCNNTMGSFACACNTGFIGDGLNCTDVNECATKPCHANATCNNTMGAFACACDTGFIGDGLNCTDVNECATKPCHANATCNNTMGSFACACDTGFIGDGLNCTAIWSSILIENPEFRKKIEDWLPVQKPWHLCYRATRDGWGSTDFHSRCDNKAATVTIVRVGQYIFGGYNDLPWTGSGGYKSSSDAFLFSLRNKDDLKPFKAPVYRNSQYAIYDSSSYGPVFGRGTDLYIVNNAHSSTSSGTNFGHTYQPPSGYSYGNSNTQALLAGSYYFTPSEVEVFYFG